MFKGQEYDWEADQNNENIDPDIDKLKVYTSKTEKDVSFFNQGVLYIKAY